MPGNVHEEKVVGLNIETIKHVPGWCPSVSMMEAGKSVQFDDMIVNAPDSGRELTYTTAGFWNKYYNRILLNAVVLTLLAMTYYISYGRYDPDNFLAGIIYGLIFGFIIAVILIVGFIAAKTDIRISGIYATLSGFILFVWTQYLEVIYWERKNRKMLIVEKTSFYAVDTGGSK